MSLRFDVTAENLMRDTNLPGITSFTFMAWIYRAGTGAGGYEAAFGFGNGTSQYALYLMTSSVARFALTDWATDFNGNSITNGVWMHLAMTCSGTGAGQLLGYRNGVLEITGNGAVITGTTAFISGGPANQAEWANMRIGGVKIYSAVLNATEIATEFNTWAPVRTANLNGWYPMTDASPANCALSVSPAPANHWTITGTLTVEADPPAATPSATFEQLHYRWRNDNGTETTATYAAAQNTPMTAPTLSNRRLRQLIDTAGADPAAGQLQLEWNRPAADAIWTRIEPNGAAALAFGANGALTTAGTTAPTVAYPTGITAGQLLIMAVMNRPNASTVATPAGWTAPANNTVTGGAGAEGVDTGLIRTTIFTRIADGTETGNVTLAITGGLSVGAVIWRVPKTTGKQWDVALATGADNTAGTAISVTFATDPGVTANDLVYIAWGCCVDTSAVSAVTLAQTGVTYGTTNQRVTQAVTTGNDLRFVIQEHPVTSGTSSAAAVWTATGVGAGTAGSAVMIRLRQVNQPVQLSPSTTPADIAAGAATSTTQQLASTPSGTFAAGRISDDTNPLPILDLTTDEYTEAEWCLQATSTAVNGHIYQFRATLAGTLLTTYTQTPQWTIGTVAGNIIPLLYAAIQRRREA